MEKNDMIVEGVVLSIEDDEYSSVGFYKVKRVFLVSEAMKGFRETRQSEKPTARFCFDVGTFAKYLAREGVLEEISHEVLYIEDYLHHKISFIEAEIPEKAEGGGDGMP